MKIGPGAMVAAAFIGPGTVVTASAAGASSGGALLWAVGFSVIATLVLQDLAARAALATRYDLSALIRHLSHLRWWRVPVLGLIVLALGVGNSAYQSGNLTGAGLGLSASLGLPLNAVIAGTAVGAGLLIWIDRYSWLERSLSLLVAIMALIFVGLAIALFPEFAASPSRADFSALSPQSITLALALIGTTVVPYNLFLHAAAVRRRWPGEDVDQAIEFARSDALWSILTGGLITASIVIVGAVLVSASAEDATFDQLIAEVDGRYGPPGRYAMGVGLFAAGLTSAIAAPVAAGWAVCGALGWSTAPGSRSFRLVALGVLLTGAFFAFVANRPIALIISAQVTNALILPLMAIILLVVINHRLVPEKHRNDRWTNGLGVVVLFVLIALALGRL